MNEQEIAFIEANIINFEAVALGFTKNIDREVLEEYANLYRKYVNKDFNFNSWCGSCVFDMLKRLSAHYEGIKYIAKLNQPKPNDVQTKNLRSRK
jgi:hypothetical protein